MIICIPDSTLSVRGMAADRVYQDADIAARRPRLDAQFVRSGWGTGCSVICRQVGLHSFRACKKLRHYMSSRAGCPIGKCRGVGVNDSGLDGSPAWF